MKKMFYSMVGSFLMILTVNGSALSFDTGKEGAVLPSSGEKSLEQRVLELETAAKWKKEGEPSWYESVKIGGVVEVEAGYSKTDYEGPGTADEKAGDVDLSAVELAVDVELSPMLSTHVLFKYEDDDVFLDEGYITWTGPQTLPVRVTAGRMVIPFGMFETRFVTDPMPLELGEANQGALVVGYGFFHDKVDVALGVFNNDVDEQGEDDTVSSYVGRVTVTPFEGLSFGASCTSSLAAADAFNEQVQDGLADDVAGWSAFVSAVFGERLTVAAEYVGAMDTFKAGEIYRGDDTEGRKPQVWNIEVGCTFADNLDAALRYGGSKDGDAGGGEFLAETQVGAVMNWGVYDKTSLSLEYMHSGYDGDYMDTDTVTARLAVEF